MTTITLDKRVPPAARAALERLEGVNVVRAPRPAIITENEVTPLDIRNVRIDDVGSEAPDGDAVVLWLIAGVLSDEDAIGLEDRGQLFVDAAGRAWVPGAPKTKQARKAGQAALRPATMRAAQLLADHPDLEWSGPRLAQRAGIGQPTASRLLKQLLDVSLIHREGGGRSAVTTVPDARALRRWLARTPQGRNAILACYVRDPDAIPADLDGVALVRSGTTGAAALGIPVTSGSPAMALRVHASGDELEQLPGRLRGVRSVRAANVLLIADPAHLGSHDARRVDGVWIAPPSRLCLDMKLEPRGAAAADVFLDLWGDRVI